MKKWAFIVFALSIAAWPADEAVKTFRGEIADNQCAMNVHSLSRSHKEMLKGKSMGNSSQSCSRMCVQRYGGHYVLQDKDTVYNIDDQKKAEQFAGSHVVVTGNLLPRNTLHVISIKAESK